MNNSYEAFNFPVWWNTLSTSFVSFYFIEFVFLLILIYYLVPKKYRWTILLVGSASFYSIAGLEALAAVLLTTVVAWGTGLCIEMTDKSDKKQRKRYLVFGIAVLLGMLIFAKCYGLFKWQFSYIVPLGISYYTFSTIGYLADVYWRKEKAEHNYFKLALFLLFFPKILQGPIAKHKTLAPQLNEGHDFDYTQFCFGIQLAIWGYFKKMVIADRISKITTTVFGSYKDYGGSILFLAILLAAFQLYMDFSGCMDIAGGVSQMFGIKLDQNFNHPFFAKSGSEFWQRWHMSLSGWFKDYLFLPVSRSEWVKKISKAVGKKFGPAARKNSIIVIASFFVWMATGIWHGSGWPYVVWGLYWYTITTSSTLLGGFYVSLKKKCRINESSWGWNLFCMARTYLLFCIGRLLTIPNDLSASLAIMKKFIAQPKCWELFDGTLFSLGMDMHELRIMWLAILAVWIIEIQQTKVSIRETIAKQHVVCRAIVYSVSILIVLIYGIYGLGVGNTTFIYMNF